MDSNPSSTMPPTTSTPDTSSPGITGTTTTSKILHGILIHLQEQTTKAIQDIYTTNNNNNNNNGIDVNSNNNGGAQKLIPIIYDEVFPSNHPFLFAKRFDHQENQNRLQNTPLSAPESNLFTVTGGYSYSYQADGGPLLGGHHGPDTTSLAWIIPTVIGIVAAMVIVGLLCFFGVRALELRCMKWFRTNCQCCIGDGEEETGNLTTSAAPINQTEMTNYKSAFTPDGEQW